MCAGAEIAGGGDAGGMRGGAAGAPDVVRRPVELVQRTVLVVRSARAAVRAPATAAHRAQACVRARASSRQRHPQATQTDLRAAPAEALQDSVHQGADAAGPRRAGHTAAAAERGEDPRVRAGEETRGAARHSDPDTGAHAARQAGGVLHQIQNTGQSFI